MKKIILGLVAVALIVSVQASVAQKAWVSNALVQRTLIDNANFGGCMALLDKNIADSGLNCPSRWVTFSCDGTFGSKDIAFRQLDQAQIAQALNKKVSLYVNDLKKHNGYCYAGRIDLK